MGFCINCDNRHGCKSKMPPCIVLMRQNDIKDTCGKAYLRSIKELKLCKECDFFLTCWNESEYQKNL